MRARDMQNERLLREIGQLWAEAERVPHLRPGNGADIDPSLTDPALDFPLSAELLERIVDRVTSMNDGGVASVEPDRLAQRHPAKVETPWGSGEREQRWGWRLPLGIAALAAISMAGVLGLLTLRYPTDSREVLAPEVRAPVSASIHADILGTDRLDIRCSGCVDGTIVELDGEWASLKDGKASLMLATPLTLGANRLTVHLQRPGAAKAEATELILPPVEYRISPNTSTLVGDAPELTLEVAAVPGSKVEIARQGVVLDSTGHGAVRVKVDAADLFGESDAVRTKEQVIGFSVETPTGNRYGGDLTARVGVTVLYLDASKTKIVTFDEQARIVGCTSPDANLWITHWSQIPLDARGCFDVPLPMDSLGYSRVTLRATRAGLAPRFVSLTLKRLPPATKD